VGSNLTRVVFCDFTSIEFTGLLHTSVCKCKNPHVAHPTLVDLEPEIRSGPNLINTTIATLCKLLFLLSNTFMCLRFFVFLHAYEIGPSI
jgi:hypothetical protein